MSMQTEVRVGKLEEQMKELQFQMSMILATIEGMTEANNNAVVEGQEATANGKISKGRKAHR